jgi:tetratricopeptide (TPR) repeat protein
MTMDEKKAAGEANGQAAGKGLEGLSAAALNDRGMALTAAGRYEEAIAAFTRGAELEPANPIFPYNRGEANRRAGRLAEAKADLEAAMASGGEEADLLLALGLVAYEADDYEAAEASYERALVLHEAFPEAWNNLGVVMFRRGDYGKARRDFEKAVALDPGYGEAWFNLRDTYEELGMKKERASAAAKAKALGVEDED